MLTNNFITKYTTKSASDLITMQTLTILKMCVLMVNRQKLKIFVKILKTKHTKTLNFSLHKHSVHIFTNESHKKKR